MSPRACLLLCLACCAGLGALITVRHPSWLWWVGVFVLGLAAEHAKEAWKASRQ